MITGIPLIFSYFIYQISTISKTISPKLSHRWFIPVLVFKERACLTKNAPFRQYNYKTKEYLRQTRSVAARDSFFCGRNHQYQ